MKEKKNLNLKHHLQNALIIGSYYQVLLTLSCWLKAEHYHSCFTLCTEHAGCCSPPEPRVWAGWPYAGMQNNDWLMHRLNENSLRFRCSFEHFQRVCCFADSSFNSTPFKYFNEIKIRHIKLVMLVVLSLQSNICLQILFISGSAFHLHVERQCSIPSYAFEKSYQVSIPNHTQLTWKSLTDFPPYRVIAFYIESLYTLYWLLLPLHIFSPLARYLKWQKFSLSLHSNIQKSHQIIPEVKKLSVKLLKSLIL